jgi:glycosyltransferase involved in cell wall biosynthesis
VIYIAIPAHNEARTLGVLLWKIRKVMAAFGRDYEIVVLDDASDDGTAEVLARYARGLPLRTVRPEQRLGYGAALERLLRDVVERSAYPKRDVVVTLQGDFTENPEDLVDMVKAIEGGADLVAGRVVDDGQVLPRPLRISRRFARILLGRAVTRAPVADPLSGFRAYRVIVVKKAIRELTEGTRLLASRGWGANLELLAKVAPHARRIEESPFRMGFQHRERASRFRALAGLRSLLGLRGTAWPPPLTASPTPTGRGTGPGASVPSP